MCSTVAVAEVRDEIDGDAWIPEDHPQFLFELTMVDCVVEECCSKAETARRIKTNSKTVSEWLKRFRAMSEAL